MITYWGMNIKKKRVLVFYRFMWAFDISDHNKHTRELCKQIYTIDKIFIFFSTFDYQVVCMTQTKAIKFDLIVRAHLMTKLKKISQ